MPMAPLEMWSDMGADGGTRTRNLRFTKPLLCQLSYIGQFEVWSGARPVGSIAPGMRSVNARGR